MQLVSETIQGGYMVRTYDNGTVERILLSTPPEPAPRPRLVVTNVTCTDPAIIAPGDVTCPDGATVTVTVELRDPTDALIPMAATFRMPLVARDGRERVLLVEFAAGVATISTTLTESGVWQIREATINGGLPPEQHMEFAGLDIYVVQG